MTAQYVFSCFILQANAVLPIVVPTATHHHNILPLEVYEIVVNSGLILYGKSWSEACSRV